MMPRSCAVPDDALLSVYAAQDTVYTDCFEVTLPQRVALADLIGAFYATALFRVERGILGLALRRRIREAEVHDLAQGADHFAVWSVEARSTCQILLCDRSGYTRSFLAVQSVGSDHSRLLFGSAVVPKAGHPLGRGMRMLIPLHRIYARALLHQAARKLRRG